MPEPDRLPVVRRQSTRTGRFPPQSFLDTCERVHEGPLRTWQLYRERCTGVVDWDLPGRSALPDVPIVGVALNLASGLVPGGGLVAGALGLTGGGTVSNGWDPWVSVGPVGLGVCPPNQRCIGGEVGGICLGACVPSAVGPPSILPPGIGRPPDTRPGNGGIFQPGNGQPIGTQICCPTGFHPNKTGYFTQAGYVAPQSKCVKNRKTNPLNPSAASRAGRRLRSAAKASKWLSKVKVPKRC